MNVKVRRKNINKLRVKAKIIIRLISIMLLVGIMVAIIFKFKYKEDNIELYTTKENLEVGVERVDNTGYLGLEDDPNADDASIVASNLKSLITGVRDYPVRSDGRKVAYLTFDDGPSITNTPKVLDILDTYNIKATFFVLGKSIEHSERAKEILREEVKRGHAIANHSYSHDYSHLYPNGNMNVDNIVEEFQKNDNILKDVLGKEFSTRTVRFPGGYWSWEGREPMRDKLNELGYCNIDWNTLNGDAEAGIKNSDELFQTFKESVENLGDNSDSIVVLMHDTYGKEETVKSLPQIIEYLQEKGYEFRTIK